MTSEWPDPSGRIKPAEFAHPDLLDPELVARLGQTREAIDRPMLFTLLRGKERHRNGDAMMPGDDHHETFSLHLVGVDHSASKRRKEIVANASIGCRAVDWDSGSTTAGDLFELYLRVEATNLWGGIGLYPYWNTKGLHTDMRQPDHPNYGARWVRDRHGIYWTLTLSNWERITSEPEE